MQSFVKFLKFFHTIIFYSIIKDNDSSVLENYHASSLFQILVTTKSDISSNLTEKEFRIFRKLCIGMILDTGILIFLINLIYSLNFRFAKTFYRYE